MNNSLLTDLIKYLDSEIKFDEKSGFECNGRELTIQFLKENVKKTKDQNAFDLSTEVQGVLDSLEEMGGYCDCEILLNVSEK